MPGRNSAKHLDPHPFRRRNWLLEFRGNYFEPVKETRGRPQVAVAPPHLVGTVEFDRAFWDCCPRKFQSRRMWSNHRSGCTLHHGISQIPRGLGTRTAGAYKWPNNWSAIYSEVKKPKAHQTYNHRFLAGSLAASAFDEDFIVLAIPLPPIP